MKTLLIGLLLLITACTQVTQITSFEECEAAGFPVMESYPRQCRANGRTFIEIIEKTSFTECETQTEICTMEYNPVCALIDNGIRCITEPCASFDAETRSNACTACTDAIGYYKKSCEENRFVICEEVNGFNIQQLASDSGWICLDICPHNYDSYTTQIGAKMCIKHYGVEKISTWSVCDKSTDSCDCVKTYETTKGEPIVDAEYRCVPEQYAERLLFRGGTDRLDENGESSVVIA